MENILGIGGNPYLCHDFMRLKIIYFQRYRTEFALITFLCENNFHARFRLNQLDSSIHRSGFSNQQKIQ